MIQRKIVENPSQEKVYLMAAKEKEEKTAWILKKEKGNRSHTMREKNNSFEYMCRLWVCIFITLIQPRLINALQWVRERERSQLLGKIYWHNCRQAIEPKSSRWTRFDSIGEITKWLMTFPLVGWIVWQCHNGTVSKKGMNSYYICVFAIILWVCWEIISPLTTPICSRYSVALIAYTASEIKSCI